MNVLERLNIRWQAEIRQLADLAGRSAGRLVVREANEVLVRLEIVCISAFHQGEFSANPEIRLATHRIRLVRSAAWPAEQVAAVHEGPAGIWHPNILGGLRGERSFQPVVAAQQLAGALNPGVICYGSAGPGLHLADITQQIYNILGYRYGAYARQHEHLNLPALQWVNAMLAANPACFPLERRPLIACTGEPHASHAD